MPPPYNPADWSEFEAIPFQAQGAINVPPAVWVANHEIAGVPNSNDLPNYQLTRQAVRSICTDPTKPVLFGYACAMAWGGQGGGSGGARSVDSAWANHRVLEARLETLRAGELGRRDAYALFCNGGEIPGLGPSYLTKLLYFFSPSPSSYIMDQWTAKSVNLLTRQKVVRMAGEWPSADNKGGNYQAFCEELDLIGGLLGCSGEIAEERIFSQGGRHPWPWRAYVKKHWPISPRLPRYSAADLHATYPHIPIETF